MTDNKLKRLRTKLSSAFIVGSVFFYFLIFAQFGFLHRLQEMEGPTYLSEVSLFVMGLGGIIGCVLTARYFDYKHAKSWLMGSFIGCGLTATTIAAVPQTAIIIMAGLGVGLSLGILTVCVVPIISKTFAGDKLGLWTGLGVGVAYGLCNVPWIFDSTPIDHCILAGGACVLGVILTNYLPEIPENPSFTLEVEWKTSPTLFYKTGLVIVVLLFLILIWMDSAVFTIIQETGNVKAAVWSDPGQLWLMGFIHFLAAVVAGWLLDRGWLLTCLIAAMGLLIIEAWGLSHPNDLSIAFATNFYVAAVSIYSTALVAYGALQPERRYLPKIQVRAAWVFGIAGWIGSGLGIGMARDLNAVPGLFILAAVAVSVFSLAGAKYLKREGGPSPRPAH